MHYIRQALGATSIYLLANGLPDFDKTMDHFSMARSQYLKSRNIDNANKKHFMELQISLPHSLNMWLIKISQHTDVPTMTKDQL